MTLNYCTSLIKDSWKIVFAMRLDLKVRQLKSLHVKENKKVVMNMEIKKKVTVAGAGSWGTALAMVLADNGHDVRLWGNNQAQIEEINSSHTNKQYLPDIRLPEAIVGYTD